MHIIGFVRSSVYLVPGSPLSIVFTLFFSSRPSFTLSLLSLKQGSIPQLITEIDLICLLQRRHMLRCVSQPTNDETYVCFMCFLYSIRRLKRKITLTFLCFSSSWLLWHVHRIFSSVLCQLSSLLDKYVTAWATVIIYSTLFCRVGESMLQVVNQLVKERWVTRWFATF